MYSLFHTQNIELLKLYQNHILRTGNVGAWTSSNMYYNTFIVGTVFYWYKYRVEFAGFNIVNLGKIHHAVNKGYIKSIRVGPLKKYI